MLYGYVTLLIALLTTLYSNRSGRKLDSSVHVDSAEPIIAGGNDASYLTNLEEVVGLRPTLKT